MVAISIEMWRVKTMDSFMCTINGSYNRIFQPMLVGAAVDHLIGFLQYCNLLHHSWEAIALHKYPAFGSHAKVLDAANPAG